MKYGMIATALMTAVVASATSVTAQAPTVVKLDIDRAIQLEQQSVALQGANEWGKAASLLRKAAQLRPAGDPIALHDLSGAAMIYGNTKKYVLARSILLELADRATEFGEVSSAADALIDAAYVTVKLKDGDSAIAYVERAQRLTNSSHLTSEQQAHFAGRLGPVVTLAAASGK